MSLARLFDFLSRFVLCAVILSVVSLSFIALYHLLVIPCSSMFVPCMTRSHLITQIKWAASDRMICRSQSIACSFSVGCGGWPALFPASCLGSVRHPVPRMVPRLMFGQSVGAYGQVCRARSHTKRLGCMLHSVNMCSMLSSTWHIAQSCLFWVPCMWFHIDPTM